MNHNDYNTNADVHDDDDNYMYYNDCDDIDKSIDWMMITILTIWMTDSDKVGTPKR